MDQKWHDVIEKSLGVILERFERDASGYGFIDTKFNIVTGEEFTGDRPYLRQDFIYGWIQGRALESLAKHHDHFSARKRSDQCARLANALRRLAGRLEICRKRYGHIWFAMTPEGAPRGEVTPDRASFADLFYGKGAYCAAAVLDDRGLAAVGEEILTRVFADIEAERFVSGQQCFDPKNPAAHVSPDQLPEGPRMIALGALADLIRLSPEREKYAAKAESFIGFILDNHVFRRDGELCFCENIHRVKRTPYADHGRVLCDPGHGIEFTGLAGRCLRMMAEHGAAVPGPAGKYAVLPELFCRLFDLGFKAGPGGIVKSADAVTGEALNTDMPWWSLPEAIRAARELSSLFPGSREALRSRAELASLAFVRYLRPNGFACQTRDREGNIVDVIPACPDADPGYHTNLCLMES